MRRMRAELIAGIALVAIGVLTIAWPDWIEELFGVDPDAGSGAVEAAIVVLSALAGAAFWSHRRSSLPSAREVPYGEDSRGSASP
jgi:hypothetical protein